MLRFSKIVITLQKLMLQVSVVGTFVSKNEFLEVPYRCVAEYLVAKKQVEYKV